MAWVLFGGLVGSFGLGVGWRGSCERMWWRLEEDFPCDVISSAGLWSARMFGSKFEYLRRLMGAPHLPNAAELIAIRMVDRRMVLRFRST